MMRKITVNKDNWSGEEITVEINDKDMSFGLYDYKFRLVLKADRSNEDFMPSKYYSVVGEGWDYPLAIVVHDLPYKFKKGESFEAFEGEHVMEGVLSREGDCLYSAAIKVLCNII